MHLSTPPPPPCEIGFSANYKTCSKSAHCKRMRRNSSSTLIINDRAKYNRRFLSAPFSSFNFERHDNNYIFQMLWLLLLEVLPVWQSKCDLHDHMSWLLKNYDSSPLRRNVSPYWDSCTDIRISGRVDLRGAAGRWAGYDRRSTLELTIEHARIMHMHAPRASCALRPQGVVRSYDAPYLGVAKK